MDGIKHGTVTANGIRIHYTISILKFCGHARIELPSSERAILLPSRIARFSVGAAPNLSLWARWIAAFCDPC
jgi:hypothetical protein